MKKIIVFLLLLNLSFPSQILAREIKANEIIRLHVIANSDQKGDQELKLKVRDEVVSQLKPALKKAKNRRDTEQILKKNLTRIEDIASNKVSSEGYSYTVKAELGNFQFPVKAYNDFVLPAGTYKALKIIIGEGAGANWWCVMFPPICFVDLNHQVLSKKESNSSQGFTQTSQFVKAKSTKVASSQIEVRFKIVELWQSIKTKIRSLI